MTGCVAYLQRMRFSTVAFSIVLFVYTLCQSIISSGLLPSCISLISTRYKFSNTQLGSLTAIYDAGVMVFNLIVAYFCAYNKPRWLGVGLFFFGIGSLFFALPQWILGAYTGPQTGGVGVDMCRSSTLAPAVCGLQSRRDAAYAIFVIGSLIQSVGGSMLYVLGPAHLDQIVQPRARLSMFLAMFYAFSTLGPAIGFLLAGALLNTWVDPGQQPPGISPSDTANWVGAYWIGFIIVGFLCLIFAIPLFFFPANPRLYTLSGKNKKTTVDDGDATNNSSDALVDSDKIGSSTNVSTILPNVDQLLTKSFVALPSSTSEFESVCPADLSSLPAVASSIEDVTVANSFQPGLPLSEESDTESLHVRYGWSELALSVVRTKSVVWGSLGAALDGFLVSGFSSFLPLAVKAMYHQTDSNAAFLIGALAIPGAAGGTIFGGWLMSRLKCKTKAASVFCFLCPLIALPVMISFYIGCPSDPLAGLSTSYADSNVLLARYNATNANAFFGYDIQTSSVHPIINNVNLNQGFSVGCNSVCACSGYPYNPVCGADNRQYFSACFAGFVCVALAGFLKLCTSSSIDLNGNTIFDRCLCVQASTLAGAKATVGSCDQHCNSLGAFLVGLFFMMFLTFANSSVEIGVILGSVEVHQRGMAIGFENVMYRLIGAIPAPLVFGSAIDATCRLWSYNCGERGDCWSYDHHQLRVSFVLIAVFVKLGAAIAFFMQYYTLDPVLMAREEAMNWDQVQSYLERKSEPKTVKFEEQREAALKLSVKEDIFAESPLPASTPAVVSTDGVGCTAKTVAIIRAETELATLASTVPRSVGDDET